MAISESSLHTPTGSSALMVGVGESKCDLSQERISKEGLSNGMRQRKELYHELVMIGRCHRGVVTVRTRMHQSFIRCCWPLKTRQRGVLKTRKRKSRRIPPRIVSGYASKP